MNDSFRKGFSAIIILAGGLFMALVGSKTIAFFEIVAQSHGGIERGGYSVIRAFPTCLLEYGWIFALPSACFAVWREVRGKDGGLHDVNKIKALHTELLLLTAGFIFFLACCLWPIW